MKKTITAMFGIIIVLLVLLLIWGEVNFIEIKDSTVNADKLSFLLWLKPEKSVKNDSLSDLKGIWKNRNVNLKSFRNKAWPQRK